MNILYGVQATGNGHISRSREMIKALRARGHTVRALLTGRDPAQLWDMDDFQPFDTRPGLTFVSRCGRVDYLATMRGLNLPRFYRDIREYDATGYDLAIVDYEPVTSRIARRRRIPCIGVGHQYAFWDSRVPRTKGDPLARWVFRNFAPVDIPIGLHWHHFGAAILPPIVPPQPKDLPPTIPGKILVYLGFESAEAVTKLLEPITEAEFFVYAGVPAPVDQGNLHLRPFSRDGFLADLHSCVGIISNAGFELTSEAIAAGKKLLVKPLAGQMEQGSNGLAMSMLNIGTVMHKLDPAVLRKWLALPTPEPAIYPDVPGMIADWIGRGGGHGDLATLSANVWAATRLPSHFRRP